MRVTDKGALLALVAPQVAKWWMPDDVAVMEALPHTGTAKILQTKPRAQFTRYFGVP